jgi:hypothetical protein
MPGVFHARQLVRGGWWIYYPHAAPRRHWARRSFSAGVTLRGMAGVTVDPTAAPNVPISRFDGGGNDTELHGSIQIMIIRINNWIYQRLNYQTEVLDERFRG